MLSVIVLHHVDSYSCRTVAKLLQQPLEGDTDVTEYTQLKQRDRDITSIIKQLLDRSSEINSEHHKGLAKLTIEPYNKNKNKTGWSGKDPLHWFDNNKKTVAPLAIIVTNLPEITKIEDRDKYKESKYFIQNTDEVISNDSNQEVRGNSKETFDRDMHPNAKHNFTEDLNNNTLIDNSDIDLDFSGENMNISNYLNKKNNSANTDIAWESQEDFDELVNKDGSNEKIYKSIEIEDKTNEFKSDNKETIDTFEDKLVDNTFKVDFPDNTINKQEDKTVNEDQENLVNLLLDNDLDIEEYHNNDVTNDLPLNGSIINLKFGHSTDDSTIKTYKGDERKCRDHRGHKIPIYNLSFLFNR